MYKSISKISAPKSNEGEKAWLDIDWSNVMIDIGYVVAKLFIIYILFLLFKRIGNNIIHRIFERYRKHDPSSKGRTLTLEGLTKNIFSYVLVFILFVSVLKIFGIDTTGILAGAGIVGLAIGFGAQGLVSDFVTGFFILLEKQMDVGDYITTGSFSGVVEQMGLKTTQIRAFDGTLHFVPNRNITSVSNHSRGNMRALVDITVPYKDRVEETIAVLQAACDQFTKEHPEVVEAPKVIGVEKLEESKVVLRVIGKTVNGEQYNIESKLKIALNEALKVMENEPDTSN